MENAIVMAESRVNSREEAILDSLGSPERDAPHSPLVEKAKARVLIVDDEPDIIRALGKRLAFAGYEVEFAGDGIEATRMAFKVRPDVVVLDIGMPCGDGHVVAERLRSNPFTMFTPIIYLTARTSDADRQQAEGARAFAYVTKPFKPEELLEVIDQAVRSLD